MVKSGKTSARKGVGHVGSRSGKKNGNAVPPEWSEGIFSGRPTFHDSDSSSFDLKGLLRTVSAHIWVALITFVLVFTAAVLLSLSIPPVYRSVAVLEIDPPTSDASNMVGQSAAQRLGVDDGSYDTEMGILTSRSQALALLKSIEPETVEKLTAKPYGPLGDARTFVTRLNSLWSPVKEAEPPTEALHDGLSEAVLNRVSVERVGTSRLIEVSFEAGEPELAQSILSQYLEIYLSRNLTKRRERRAGAGDWLDEELARSEKKFVESMAEMVNFNNTHGVVSLDDNGNHVIQFFNKTAEGLIRSKEERARLEALEMESSEGRAMLPPEISSPDLQQLNQRLAVLEAEYNSRKEIYSDEYPKMQLLKKEIQSLRQRIKEIKSQVLSQATETARTREKFQEEAFEKARQQAMDTNSLGVHYAVLKKEAETNEQIYKLLLQKKKELELNTQIIGNNARVVDFPSFPRFPVQTAKWVHISLGLGFAVFCALGMVLLVEHLDDRVQSVEDLEEILELPVLGAVPKISRAGLNGGGEPSKLPLELNVVDAPQSMLGEAVNLLRTTLEAHLDEFGGRCVLLITSSEPNEGKTFISVSLAAALLSDNKTAVVVDCDLRRGRIGELFSKNGANNYGLSTLLEGKITQPRQVLHRSSVPRLYYVPSGPETKNPVAALGSKRFKHFVTALTTKFDYVILDAPPAIQFSDAMILSEIADASLLVVRQGSAPARVVQRAKAIIDTSKGFLVGGVLNMVVSRSYLYGRYKNYYGYYGYGYGRGYKRKGR